MTLDTGTTLQIVQVIMYLVGVVYFVAMIKADIRVVRHDMAALKSRQDILNDAFMQLTTILTKVAVQDQRIAGIEEDIREIKHGKGFVTALAGEYTARGKVER